MRGCNTDAFLSLFSIHIVAHAQMFKATLILFPEGTDAVVEDVLRFVYYRITDALMCTSL